MQKVLQGLFGYPAGLRADDAVLVVMLTALKGTSVARCAARQQELLDQCHMGTCTSGQHVRRDAAQIRAVLISADTRNEVWEVIFREARTRLTNLPEQYT